MQRRTNETWLRQLQGAPASGDGAHDELAAYTLRVLEYTLSRYAPTASELNELAQTAMGEIIASLPAFPGDGPFLTWAATIAARVSFSRMRSLPPHADHSRTLRKVEADVQFIEGPGGRGSSKDLSAGLQNESAPGAGQGARAAHGGDPVLERLHRAMETELDLNQRLATLAIVRGVPVAAIAKDMSTSPEAVHRLIRAARVRLIGALERDGVTPAAIERSLFEGSDG